MCCLSGWSGEVCRGLVQDYFQLTPSAPPHFAAALRALPTMAPLFTANLITTLSQLYAKIGTVQVLPLNPTQINRDGGVVGLAYTDNGSASVGAYTVTAIYILNSQLYPASPTTYISYSIKETSLW